MNLVTLRHYVKRTIVLGVNDCVASLWLVGFLAGRGRRQLPTNRFQWIAVRALRAARLADIWGGRQVGRRGR
jgi:hypothetical protein